MISREDPYPLVNLEVAALAKPIICFRNSGGSQEFVENDAGFIVSYLDVEKMADKIIYLFNNQNIGIMLGQNAKEKSMKDIMLILVQ